MRIITRKQCIEKGLLEYFTGKPCKYGHIAKRKRSGGCTECIHLESEKSKELRRMAPAITEEEMVEVFGTN